MVIRNIYIEQFWHFWSVVCSRLPLSVKYQYHYPRYPSYNITKYEAREELLKLNSSGLHIAADPYRNAIPMNDLGHPCSML